MYSVLAVLSIAMYAAVPIISFMGIRRLIGVRRDRSSIFLPSVFGFGLGLASVLLALIAVVGEAPEEALHITPQS
ncbi:MAG TPA: hypothetical protein VGK36_08700 [Candidatus Angelobacter sp.]|jgi:hypothetical protein